jgi:bifunctional aspartokinase / homoserine dehydrogenase 1
MKTLTMKFGGTSVGTPEAIQQVAAIITETIDAGQRVVVVVSAMSGVTNSLLACIRAAVGGDKWEYSSLSRSIRNRHVDTVNLLMEASTERDAIIESIHELMDQQLQLCDAINILGEATPRIKDALVSFGERLSSRLIAAVLAQRGVLAEAYTGSDFILTNDNYQNAEPLWPETEKRIREGLLPDIHAGITPVITGFIGAAPDGSITTLGRGGSDFSAAIFAAYTDSDELIIWTDVDGVMTTDPRLDRRARVLPYVSYSEVGEMAYYGAKVLHPKTVQPIIQRGIAMRVRNTFNVQHPGTLIGAEQEHSATVLKAVTCVRSVSMLTIAGKGMLGVPGIAGRTFLASAQAGANILMISQSSSEQSFCFTVTDDRAQAVKDAVESELAAEIGYQDVDGVDVLSEVVIVTAVGAGMRHQPGVAGRIFTVMGDHGVNVLAIAQGSSECSISFVIDEADLDVAVARLHDLALEATPQIN